MESAQCFYRAGPAEKQLFAANLRDRDFRWASAGAAENSFNYYAYTCGPHAPVDLALTKGSASSWIDPTFAADANMPARGSASGYQCINSPSYSSLKRTPVCGHIGPACHKIPQNPLSIRETAAGCFVLFAIVPLS